MYGSPFHPWSSVCKALIYPLHLSPRSWHENPLHFTSLHFTSLPCTLACPRSIAGDCLFNIPCLSSRRVRESNTILLSFNVRFYGFTGIYSHPVFFSHSILAAFSSFCFLRFVLFIFLFYFTFSSSLTFPFSSFPCSSLRHASPYFFFPSSFSTINTFPFFSLSHVSFLSPRLPLCLSHLFSLLVICPPLHKCSKSNLGISSPWDSFLPSERASPLVNPLLTITTRLSVFFLPPPLLYNLTPLSSASSSLFL